MIDLAATAAKSVSAWDQPGTLAFLVIFGMGAILFFVFRSMAKQLRKVNEAARLEATQAEARDAGAVPTLPGGDQGVPPRPGVR